MSKTVRITLAITTLVISISLLMWGLLPGKRQVRRQFIQPTQMQLPTPGAFVPYRVQLAHIFPLEKTQTTHFVACFVLIL
jgi:hypothetical protein